MRQFVSSIYIFALCLFLSTNVVAEEARECGKCGGAITDTNNVFMITGQDAPEQEFGCPGCGLAVLAKMPPEQYANAKAQDFLRRTMIDAQTAWYLRGTEIGFCCEPYWLAFASKDEAEKFAKGFGGEVLDFESAIKLAPKDHDHVHHHSH